MPARKRLRPSFANVAATLALVIAIGGVSWAAIPGSDGVIKACYNNQGGGLRVTDTDPDMKTIEPCNPDSETPIDCNRQGPAGPSGPSGPQGPQGPAGSNGQNGNGNDSQVHGMSLTRSVKGPSLVGLAETPIGSLVLNPGQYIAFAKGTAYSSGRSVGVARGAEMRCQLRGPGGILDETKIGGRYTGGPALMGSFQVADANANRVSLVCIADRRPRGLSLKLRDVQLIVVRVG
jgi:hypothetical protein